MKIHREKKTLRIEIPCVPNSGFGYYGKSPSGFLPNYTSKEYLKFQSIVKQESDYKQISKPTPAYPFLVVDAFYYIEHSEIEESDIVHRPRLAPKATKTPKRWPSMGERRKTR